MNVKIIILNADLERRDLYKAAYGFYVSRSRKQGIKT